MERWDVFLAKIIRKIECTLLSRTFTIVIYSKQITEYKMITILMYYSQRSFKDTRRYTYTSHKYSFFGLNTLHTTT